MTPAQLAANVRYDTKNDSTSLSDSKLTLLYNYAKDMVADRITEKVDKDYFITPFYRDLKLGQKEYSVPSDYQGTIERLEALLDPIANQYIELYPMDLAYLRGEYDGQFTNEPGMAYYDFQRSSLVLYCGDIPEVPNGLRLWAASYPEDIKDERWTDSMVDLSVPQDGINHPMPRAVHDIIHLLMVERAKERADKPIPLSQVQQNVDALLSRKLNLLKRAFQDPNFTIRPARAYNKYDNGWNL